MRRNMSIAGFLMTAVTIVCVGFPVPGAAQALSPLKVSDVLGGHSFGEASPLALSPDGRLAAYMVRSKKNVVLQNSELEEFVRTGIIWANQAGEIWTTDTQTGATQNLTGETGSNWQPTWSPDGSTLAFLSDRDGSGQTKVWLWNVHSDKLRLGCDVPIRISPYNELLWTRDSRNLLVATLPKGISVENYANKILTPRTPDTTLIPGATVTFYQSGVTGSTSGEADDSPTGNLDVYSWEDLVLIDVKAGKTDTIVHGHRVEGYFLSPDDAYVSYAEPKRFYKPGSFRRVFDLRIVNLKTKEDRPVATDILLNDAPSWSPDGSRFVYATYGADDRSYELYVMPAEGPKPTRISSLAHQTSDRRWLKPAWGPDNDHFYFLLDGMLYRGSSFGGSPAPFARILDRRITHVICPAYGHLWTIQNGTSTVVLTRDEEGKQDGFYRIDLRSGETAKLREEGRCYECKWSSDVTAVSRDGNHLIYISEDAQHPPDLWTADGAFRDVRQLTHLNPQFENYKLGSAQVISWWSDDGEPLHGALLLPPDYSPGRRYPMLVWVYPGYAGSKASDEFGFGGENLGPLNMQLFATRGYVVLFPDTTERVGERFAGLVKSVLPAVSKVVDMGIADPERVGVMGHSQGGFASLALLVATNRFKAAMSADGWGDSTAYYGILGEDGSSYQYGQAEWQLGASPWQRPSTYIENSQIYYLDRVTAPLLLVQGALDSSHPSFLADEIFVGLRRLGKRVDYAKYRNEGHALSDWSYANQTDVANRVINWFHTYLEEGANPPDARK